MNCLCVQWFDENIERSPLRQALSHEALSLALHKARVPTQHIKQLAKKRENVSSHIFLELSVTGSIRADAVADS